MKPYTQMVPQARIKSLMSFNSRINQTTGSVAVLTEWGFKLTPNLIKLQGHKLVANILKFGNKDHR